MSRPGSGYLVPYLTTRSSRQLEWGNSPIIIVLLQPECVRVHNYDHDMDSYPVLDLPKASRMRQSDRLLR